MPILHAPQGHDVVQLRVCGDVVGHGHVHVARMEDQVVVRRPRFHYLQRNDVITDEGVVCVLLWGKGVAGCLVVAGCFGQNVAVNRHPRTVGSVHHNRAKVPAKRAQLFTTTAQTHGATECSHQGRPSTTESGTGRAPGANRAAYSASVSSLHATSPAPSS